MKVIITGATGYVGEGVLRCCLEHPLIESVLSVSRRTAGISHPKLEELLVDDFMKLASGDVRLAGYDAVFFIAGISSVGCPKEKYFEISRSIPVHFAEILSDRERMTYIYLSGAGTNADGKLEWQRVKGGTEKLLAAMPFKGSFGFRPAFMRPHRAQTNRRGFQLASRLLYPVCRLLKLGNTMEEVAAAMIACSQNGYGRNHIEVGDIRELAERIQR